MPELRHSICFLAPHAFPLLSGDLRTEVIGGAEVQQVIVAKGLAGRGYRVRMICLDFGQQDRVEIDGVLVLRAFAPDEGVPVIRYLSPRLTSIWRCLASAGSDIYYQRTAGMLTGVMAAYARRAGKKSIFAAAGNPDLELRTPRVRFARDRWLYEYGLRNVDEILVQNAEQARLCKVNFRRDALIVPNCYPAVRRRSANVGRYVLWVSTIRKIKRPALFLELAQALPNLQFRMIGGPGAGEEELFKSIKVRAEALSNLDFLGFVPYAQAEVHFDDAAILVNTSESEGFPNTFLQSWARGVPTISFVDSGARSEGQTIGRQVKGISEMVHWVERWSVNEHERADEGYKCREYFEHNHAPARILDLYEHLFDDLMTSKS